MNINLNKNMLIINRTMKLIKEGHPINDARELAIQQLINEGKITE